jgi:hypothetical protein
MCALLHGTVTVPYALLPWHNCHRPLAFFCCVFLKEQIPDFYSVKFLVRWIVGIVEKLGRDVVKSLIISDNQVFMAWLSNPLIIRLFPLNSLTWLSRISDTSENKPESLDSDNQINISRLISFLEIQFHVQSEESRNIDLDGGFSCFWVFFYPYHCEDTKDQHKPGCIVFLVCCSSVHTPSHVSPEVCTFIHPPGTVYQRIGSVVLHTVKPWWKPLRILCHVFLRKIYGLILSTRLEDEVIWRWICT